MLTVIVYVFECRLDNEKWIERLYVCLNLILGILMEFNWSACKKSTVPCYTEQKFHFVK